MSYSSALLQRVSTNDMIISKDEILQSKVRSILEREIYRLDLATNKHWIVFDRNLPFRIQDGPTCGLVALMMVVDYLVKSSGESPPNLPSSETVKKIAIEKGFSSDGDMFKAADLAEMCKILYSDHGIFAGVEPYPVHMEEWVNNVVDKRRICLVPYDAAKNNEPYHGNGSHAHWAVVKGLAIPALLTDQTEEEQISVKYHFEHDLNIPELSQILLRDTSKDEGRKYFVLGQHGKSKLPVVWENGQLESSNKQLRLAKDKRGSEISLENLNDKVVWIWR